MRAALTAMIRPRHSAFDPGAFDPRAFAIDGVWQ
jgi:hypothetical protein